MQDPADLPLPTGAPPDSPSDGRRWRLLGDVALFQGKLLLDGLRDLLLSPVSIALALFGLLTSKDDPGRHFYRLMEWGRWTDGAINLFGAGAKTRSGTGEENVDGLAVDRLAAEIEAALLERYQRSELARKARSGIDSGLDRLAEQSAAGGGRLREALRRAARRLMREQTPAGRPGAERNSGQT